MGVFLRGAVVLALTLAYFDHVFQLRQGVWLRSGLSAWIDPYLINAILEHWNYSVRHFADPASPPMFYPETGTLGYSVGLIFYAAVYVLLRPWLHPFAAYTLTLFIVMVIGTLCLYAILRRFLALGFIEALIVTAFFSTSSNVVAASHTDIWAQVASVFVIPPILLLGLVAGHRAPGRLAWIGMWLTGCLMLLLFVQDFYTGLLASLIAALALLGTRLMFRWPSMGGVIRIVQPAAPPPALSMMRRVLSWMVFGLGIVALCWISVDLHGNVLGIPFESHHHHWERPGAVAAIAFSGFSVMRRGILTKLRFRLPPFSSRVAAFGLGAIAGAAVFLWIYLGAFLERYGWSQDQMMRQLFQRDLSNWRHPLDLIRSLLPFVSGRSFLLVFVVGILAWLPWLRVDRRARLGSVWFLLISVFVVLAGLELSGFSIWKTFLGFLPGFSAIRDTKRLIYSYELAVALVIGVFLSRLPRRSLFRYAIVGLAGWLLVTEWNRSTFAYERPIAPFDRFVQSPIAIDKSCRSFFVKAASPAYEARSSSYCTLYNLDAAFIAAQTGVPTLNGFSAWLPEGFGLCEPRQFDYGEAVMRWIDAHDLQNVCVLDLDDRTMTPYRQRGQ